MNHIFSNFIKKVFNKAAFPRAPHPIRALPEIFRPSNKLWRRQFGLKKSLGASLVGHFQPKLTYLRLNLIEAPCQLVIDVLQAPNVAVPLPGLAFDRRGLRFDDARLQLHP